MTGEYEGGLSEEEVNFKAEPEEKKGKDTLEKHYKTAKRRHSNPHSVGGAFRANEKLLDKIVDVPNRFQKEVTHIMSDKFKPTIEIQEARAKFIVEENKIMGDYFKEGGKYLDIGCGKGHLMHEIEKANMDKAIQFLGVDNYDYPTSGVRKQIAETRKNEIEPRMEEMEKESGKEMRSLDFGKMNGKEKDPQIFAYAEGENLPFKDGQFDGASMFYFLHYLSPEKQKEVLEEAMRVIGDDPEKYIFVLEETADTPRQAKVSERHDRIANPELLSKNIPKTRKSNEEWVKFFEESGLEVADSHYYSTEAGKEELQNAFFVLRKAR